MLIYVQNKRSKQIQQEENMIHRQFAQRRRLMAGETVKMVTLTLTGSFDNSGLFGERYVAVDGEIITELGTYNVRQGCTIILHTKIKPHHGRKREVRHIREQQVREDCCKLHKSRPGLRVYRHMQLHDKRSGKGTRKGRLCQDRRHD